MTSVIRGSDNFDTAGGNAVKAWVNFNGTGAVAIRASYNVSSITDLGVGNYTVNFTNALPDVNYAFVVSASGDGGTGNILAYTTTATPRTTTACRVITTLANTAAGFDTPELSAVALR